MKKIIPALLAILLITSLSCHKSSTDFNLGLDLQSSFDQDKVEVFIDGKPELNKQVQTNYSLGLCPGEGLTLTKEEGKHTIKVIVNGIVIKEETFFLNDNLYIGVNFEKQFKQIILLYSDNPFMYD